MVRRRRDYWFWYDRDTGGTIPLAQRTYKGTHSETPITLSFLSRIITAPQPPRAVVKPKFAARRITACFVVPDGDGNPTAESNLAVFCPFRSGSRLTLQHLREVKAFPGVRSANYQGESF